MSISITNVLEMQPPFVLRGHSHSVGGNLGQSMRQMPADIRQPYKNHEEMAREEEEEFLMLFFSLLADEEL